MNTHNRRISTSISSIKNKLTKRQDVPVVKNVVSLSNTELLGAYGDVDNIVDRCSRLTGNPKVCLQKACSRWKFSRIFQYLLLTGGFGQSPYLQNVLAGKLETQGTKLVVLSEYP